MNVSPHEVVIDGHRLHRLVLSPVTEPIGGLLFFHGQGDFIDRYPPILEGFVDAGYQCILTDLPGHGQSSGKRGHVPGLDFIDALATDSLACLKGPCLVAGHSMGGLMALRYFLRNPGAFEGAWFSSPLLHILDRTHPILKIMLPFLARICPRLTVGTGVTSEDCGDRSEPSDSATDPSGTLYHDRISLAWGLELCAASALVWDRIDSFPTDKPILFTQGGRDAICPPEVLNQLIGTPPSNNIRVNLLADALHEPFTGSTREELLLHLETWIKKDLSPLKKPPPQNFRGA